MRGSYQTHSRVQLTMLLGWSIAAVIRGELAVVRGSWRRLGLEVLRWRSVPPGSTTPSAVKAPPTSAVP